MANNGNTLTIEINGQTVQLERSLKSINASLQQTKREAKALSNDLKFDPTNSDLAVKRQEALARALTLSQEKAKLLQEDLDKIDPEVDPKGFNKLSNQLDIAQREVKSFTRQFDVAVKATDRLKTTASHFSFDFGDGVKQFENSIRGIDAIISSLGKKSDLVKFDKARASSQDVSNYLKKLDDYIDLSDRKAKLLKRELKDINVRVDPKGFEQLQNKINDVESDIKHFKNLKARVSVDVDDKATEKSGKLKTMFSGLVTGAKSQAEKIASSLGTSVVSGLSRVASTGSAFVRRSFGVIGEGIVTTVTATASGLGKALDSFVLRPLGSIGKGITNALTAPFRVGMSAVHEIVRGALLTVGQNITNTLTQTIRGAFSSMGDASKSAKSLENVLSFQGVDTGTIDKLKEDMADYAKVTTFASSELNKVVASLSASNVEAGKAGALTKSIGNAYALLGDGSRSISDIGVIFSQINSAGKLLTQDFNQLRDAGLGGAIKQDIEKNFPDIIAQFGSFSEAMSKGAISANMVNEAITRIGNSSEANKAATVPKTMNDAWQTLQETIGQKFIGVYENISKKGIAFISNFTDKIDSMDFSNLSNQILGTFDKLTNISKVVSNALSKVDLSGFINTFQKSFGVLSKSVKEFTSSDLFKGLLDNTKLIFSNIGDIIKNVFSGVGNALKGINIGGVTSDIIKSIKNITDHLNKFTSSDVFQKTLTGLFGTIAVVFQSVLNIVEAITKKLGGLSNDGAGVGQVFKNIQSIISTTQHVVENLINTLGDAFAKVDFGGTLSQFDTFSKSIDKVTNSPFFSGVVTGVLSNIKTILDSVITSLSDVFDKLSETPSNGLVTVFDTINNVVSSFVGAFKNGILSVIDVLNGKELGDKLGQFGESVKSMFDSLQEFTGSENFKTILTGLLSVVLSLETAMMSLIKNVLDAFTSSDISDSLTKLKDGFTDFGDAINELLNTDFTKSLLKEGLDLIMSVAGDIVKILADLIHAFNDLLGGFDWSTITKPLEAFIDTVKGFLENVFKPIREAIDSLNESGALDELMEAFKGLGEALAKIFEYIKPITDFVGKLIGMAIGDFITGLVVLLKPLVEILKKIFEFVSGLAEGVGSAFSWLSDKVGNLFNGSANSYSNAPANYSTYSVGNYATSANYNTATNNTVHINISGGNGSPLDIARMVRREFELGTA